MIVDSHLLPSHSLAFSEPLILGRNSNAHLLNDNTHVTARPGIMRAVKDATAPLFRVYKAPEMSIFFLFTKVASVLF